MLPVLDRPAASDDDFRVGQQLTDQLDRPRRRGDDDARVLAEAQAEHQHVPGRRVAPGGQLVAPGEIVLRTAQPVRLVGREQCRDRTIRPGQAMQRGLVMRPFAKRADREETALALDHDGAGVERGRRDQRDPSRETLLDTCPNEFGAGAGLAEAAPGQQEPDPPVAKRRYLRPSGPREIPVAI
jgi:hypothetical protein